MNNLPIVAIIGRPNVGKSSLFNRILKEDKAIISETPGTTRNVVEGLVKGRGNTPYLLVDTAGIMELDVPDHEVEALEDRVQEQVRFAIHSADLLIFMIDVRAKDVLSTDLDAAKIMRKSKIPCIFVANKCDNEQLDQEAYSFLKLGLGMPICLSVSHKRNLKDLDKRIIEELKKLGFDRSDEEKEEVIEDTSIKIALAGTPNVGKSALLNAFVGSEKALVSDVAGTTRDVLDISFNRDEKIYTLVDTAGIRRRGKIEQGIEGWSVLRTMKSIERAHVALLVFDATKGITKQDMHVAEHILEAKKGLIIVVNKWDQIKEISDLPTELQEFRMRNPDPMGQYLSYIQWKLDFLPWAPVIFVSAKTGKNVEKILDLVNVAYESRFQRIDTGKLNRFVTMITTQHKPTGTKTIAPKISYATQVAVDPPEFVFFVNKKEAFHFSYLRYLENRIREKYGFEGTAISLELRDKTKKDYTDKEQEQGPTEHRMRG